MTVGRDGRASKQAGTRGRDLKDSEFVCDLCHANCTRDPTSGTEYGHEKGCDERPDGLRPNRGISHNE
jgi:hypothetical protein